jgi:hypothetical protein
MIASILCMSRVRRFTGTMLLHRFLDNVREYTTDMSDIEILCRIDDDDTATAEALKDYPEVTPIVGPRMEGYRSVPDFYNEMATIAKGTWLPLFSDDLLIETKGWEKILYDYNEYTTHILKPQHPKVFGGNLFPIMHSNLFKVVGHSGIFPADWWWDIVGTAIPLHVEIPVVIEHIGSGVPGDTVEGAWSNANHQEHWVDAPANTAIGKILAARGK